MDFKLTDEQRELQAIARKFAAERIGRRTRFLPPFLDDETAMTAPGITEPHAGSDNSSGYDGDLAAGPQTSAGLADLLFDTGMAG